MKHLSSKACDVIYSYYHKHFSIFCQLSMSQNLILIALYDLLNYLEEKGNNVREQNKRFCFNTK